MTDRDSGGKNDELIEQLGQIDRWLDQLSPSSEGPVLGKSAQPKPGLQTSSASAASFTSNSKNTLMNTSDSRPPEKKSLFDLGKNLFTRPSRPEPAKSSSTPASTAPGGQSPKPQGGDKPHGDRRPSRHRDQRRKSHAGGARPNTGRPHGGRPQPHKPYMDPSQKPSQGSFRPLAHKKLRIVPLGGLEEVGKNMMMFEYENDIIIVDMGFQFPTTDMLGVDYVLPDITYLLQRKHKIRGVFLTHGHLDHIGGIPYLIPQLGFPPVYGAPLTIGFVEKQLAEFDLLKQAKLVKFDPAEQFRAGAFSVSFFRVNHSIPDAVAVVIDTPCGRLVHTGDFKFDFTPADQRPADFQEIAAVGKKGVAVLISDSTNSLEPGHTVSEKHVAQNLDDIIREAKGRLIVTSFSSLIGRLQQVMDSAIRYNRRIFLTGRSMEMNIRIAQNLGYIRVPKGLIGDVRKMGRIRDEEVIILTTGSQGEDVSALARMANQTHAKVKIQPGDTVVLSASPIIGNEAAVMKVINGLCRLGAKIITNRDIDIHTSGHAKQEDLKLMIKLLKPKYLIPAHGDLYMRMAHRDLAMEIGMPEKNVFLLDNGDVVEGEPNLQFLKTKDKVPANHIMVEGPERSEVGEHILCDRHLMSENGAITLVFHASEGYELKKKPVVETRGFIYMDFSKKVLEEITSTASHAFNTYVQNNKGHVDKKALSDTIQQSVDRLLVRMIDKRPVIIPVILH